MNNYENFNELENLIENEISRQNEEINMLKLIINENTTNLKNMDKLLLSVNNKNLELIDTNKKLNIYIKINHCIIASLIISATCYLLNTIFL